MVSSMNILFIFFLNELLNLCTTELQKRVSLNPKSRWLATFSKSIYLVAVDSSRSPVHFSPFFFPSFFFLFPFFERILVCFSCGEIYRNIHLVDLEMQSGESFCNRTSFSW